jgi:hypothetical protein
VSELTYDFPSFVEGSDLFPYVFGFLCGFIAWRILELVQLTGDRLRLKRKRAELAQALSSCDASRRLLVSVRSEKLITGELREMRLVDVELRELVNLCVAAADPFASGPLTPENGDCIRIHGGQTLVVELTPRNQLGETAELARVVAWNCPA